MAKSKEKSGKGVQNKHLYSRASYMHRAAEYLSAQVTSDFEKSGEAQPSSSEAAPPNEPGASAMTTSVSAAAQLSSSPASGSSSATRNTLPPLVGRHLLTQMRGVSRKTQTRIPREIKRAVCKRCDTLLVPGRTASAATENESKGGRKKHADVYVVRCLACGTAKRFPVGMEKQVRKGLRVKKVDLNEGVEVKGNGRIDEEGLASVKPVQANEEAADRVDKKGVESNAVNCTPAIISSMKPAEASPKGDSES